jgi:hypothetical protein
MTITTQAVREIVEAFSDPVLNKSASAKARWAAALVSDMLLALVEERDRLYARLEMVEAYDGEGNRLSVAPYSIPDGIEARDATIRLLDDRVKALTARAEAAEAERDRLAAQIAFYEQLTETRNGEVRHLTERVQAAEAERDRLAEANAKKADDIVTLGQLVGKAEARAEAAEAALRDLRSSVKLVRDEMRSDASIDTEDWETVLGDAITDRAALQGRDGDG